MRKDFWQLMDVIMLRGMGVQAIYTNGRLATEKFFENLEKRYMHPMIQFSFDGIGAHDWMRGVDGAEKDVIEAMKRCKRHGFSFNAVMSLCKDNAASIRETVKLMADLGCSHFKVGTAYAQGEWANYPSMIGLPIEEKFPNMLDTPLEDILDKGLYMDIINYSIKGFMDHNPDCRECEYKNLCVGGCRAFAVRDVPDDYLSKDLWSCKYYKGGWMDKKNELFRKLGLITENR